MLFGTTIEDTLGAGARGRSRYGEAAVIGGLIAYFGTGLRVALEGLESFFGGALRAEEEQGGHQNHADDYEGDERNEEIGHGRVE